MITAYTFREQALLRTDALPHPLLDAMVGVIAGRALHLAVKTGVVDALNAGQATASGIASQTGLAERSVLALLECLEPLGYVKKTRKGHALTSRGKKFLVPGSKRSLKSAVLLADMTFESLAGLERTLRAGGPTENRMEGFTPPQWEVFNQAMAEVARTNAKEVAARIELTKSTWKLLDLGGGHGLYSIELCRRYPDLKAEVLDFGPVKEMLERNVAEAKLQDRVTFRGGNFLRDPLGEGWDVVLAFNVVHGLRPVDNRALFNRAAQALSADGMLVVLDQVTGIRGHSRLSRLTTAALGLNLLHQAGGQAYSVEELRGWAAQAGFTKVQVVKVRTPGDALILCRK